MADLRLDKNTPRRQPPPDSGAKADVASEQSGGAYPGWWLLPGIALGSLVWIKLIKMTLSIF